MIVPRCFFLMFQDKHLSRREGSDEGHNIFFYAEIWETIHELYILTLVTRSTLFLQKFSMSEFV